MTFGQTAGNEDNLRRWEQRLCDDWSLVVRVEEDDSTGYRKAEVGEMLHQILKNHSYVGSLFEELIRDRVWPGNW